MFQNHIYQNAVPSRPMSYALTRSSGTLASPGPADDASPLPGISYPDHPCSCGCTETPRNRPLYYEPQETSCPDRPCSCGCTEPPRNRPLYYESQGQPPPRFTDPFSNQSEAADARYPPTSVDHLPPPPLQSGTSGTTAYTRTVTETRQIPLVAPVPVRPVNLQLGSFTGQTSNIYTGHAQEADNPEWTDTASDSGESIDYAIGSANIIEKEITYTGQTPKIYIGHGKKRNITKSRKHKPQRGSEVILGPKAHQASVNNLRKPSTVLERKDILNSDEYIVPGSVQPFQVCCMLCGNDVKLAKRGYGYIPHYWQKHRTNCLKKAGKAADRNDGRGNRQEGQEGELKENTPPRQTRTQYWIHGF